MLKPIPRQMLTHTATLRVPTSDAYGVASYADTTLERVHIQHTNDTARSKENIEVRLSAILFYDAKLSVPFGLDLLATQIAAQAQNAQLKVKYGAQEFTVLYVETVPDDKGVLHHYEVGLI